MSLSDYGITAEPIQLLSVLFLSLFAILAVLSAVFWLLRALGVYEMERHFDPERAWFAFVPFFYSCAVGRLAGNSRTKTGASFSAAKVLLPILSVLTAVCGLVSLGFLSSAGISVLFSLDHAVATESTLQAADFAPLISAMLPIALTCLFAVVYRIIFLISFYRIGVLFDPLHAGIKTVLGLFFPFLIPIFLFSMRKKTPLEEEKTTGFSNFHFGE